MKPLYLGMKAFGPYIEKQTVDFTAYNSGLFLITGDTGAGKTTIYDAVMFALFEETSNKPNGKDTEKGSVRDKNMLHSSFVSKGEPTEVELRFEENGKTYTVTRTIKYSKVRGTADTYGDAKFDANLSDGDTLSVTGSERVTAEIKRIIGMDALQFRQIAMLAQGEFKAFLEARDNVRKEILGKVFDGSPYAALMKSLSAAKQKLSAENLEIKKRREQVLQPTLFPLPDDLPDDARAGYSPEHPDILENIRALTEGEKAEIKTTEKHRSELEDILQRLKDLRSAADYKNGELDILDRLTAEQAELQSEKTGIDGKRLRYAACEKAVHTVLPLYEKARSASLRKDELEKKQAAACAEWGLAEKECTRTGAALEEISAMKARRDELLIKAAKIAESLSDYDELSKAVTALAEAERAHKKAEAGKAEAENALEEKKQLKIELSGALSELAAAETDAVHAENRKAEAERMVAMLTGENGLSDSVKKIGSLKLEYEETYKDRSEKFTFRQRTRELYEALNERFFRCQAAVLAKELRMELDGRDEAYCPVCGSHVTHADIPRFAADGADSVSQDDVKNAENEARAAEKAFGEAATSYELAKSALANALDTALRRADELLDGHAPWSAETLLDGHTLTAAIRAKEFLSSEAAEALANAHERLAEKERLQEELKHCEADIEALSQTMSDLARRIAESAAASAHGSEAVKTLGRKLEYADKSAALGAKRASDEEAEKLRRDIQALEKAHADAKERMDTAAARKQTLTQQAESAAAEYRSAQNDCLEALRNGGFADEAEYLNTLPDADGGGYEARLSLMRQEIADYDNRVKNNAEKLSAQKAKIAGYNRTDTGEIEEKIAERSAELKAVSDRLDESRTRLSLHTNALETIEDSFDAQKKLLNAYKRIEKLSDTANGASGDGGKHAFDGYVLGKSFDEVLARATMHLDVMTGGRFTLVHEESGRHKSSAADFVINIIDRAGGEQREIGSISGGESFQVSMALALGLSDVAQAHAFGGKRIEAMFVDEGFGTLDSNALANMLMALKQVSGGKRLIGMISHVDNLEEYIPERISVRKNRNGRGSHIEEM